MRKKSVRYDFILRWKKMTSGYYYFFAGPVWMGVVHKYGNEWRLVNFLEGEDSGVLFDSLMQSKEFAENSLKDFLKRTEDKCEGV